MEKITGKVVLPAKAAGDDLVRMYPSNQLKSQVRDPKDSLSAFNVLKETFFVKDTGCAELLRLGFPA